MEIYGYGPDEDDRFIANNVANVLYSDILIYHHEVSVADNKLNPEKRINVCARVRVCVYIYYIIIIVIYALIYEYSCIYYEKPKRNNISFFERSSPSLLCSR